MSSQILLINLYCLRSLYFKFQLVKYPVWFWPLTGILYVNTFHLMQTPMRKSNQASEFSIISFELNCHQQGARLFCQCSHYCVPWHLRAQATIFKLLVFLWWQTDLSNPTQLKRLANAEAAKRLQTKWLDSRHVPPHISEGSVRHLKFSENVEKKAFTVPLYQKV